MRKLQERRAYSEHYVFQSVLGEGSFCTVYRAIDKETNTQIAVKVIKRKNLHKDGVSLLRKEAELLQTINHANIVKFKHVSTIFNQTCVVCINLNFFTFLKFKEIKGKIFLGMELMQGGRLSDLIKAKK